MINIQRRVVITIAACVVIGWLTWAISMVVSAPQQWRFVTRKASGKRLCTLWSKPQGEEWRLKYGFFRDNSMSKSTRGHENNVFPWCNYQYNEILKDDTSLTVLLNRSGMRVNGKWLESDKMYLVTVNDDGSVTPCHFPELDGHVADPVQMLEVVLPDYPFDKQNPSAWPVILR